MGGLKRFLKRNSRNVVFKAIAGLGRSINRLYENRNHDPVSNGEVDVVKKIASFKPQIIVDGGANTGRYSTMANGLIPDARIFAFEPVPDTYEEMKSNVGRIENIIPVNKGLYSKDGRTEINLFESSTHSSLFAINGVRAQNKIEIALISGDSFMKEHGIEVIDFLKIDVEGSEFEVLIGFQEAISRGRIKMIQFEYGYINISTRKLLIDFYEFFEKHNYRVGKVYPKYVEFRNYNWKHEDFIGPNFIAVLSSEKKWIEALSKKD